MNGFKLAGTVIGTFVLGAVCSWAWFQAAPATKANLQPASSMMLWPQIAEDPFFQSNQTIDPFAALEQLQERMQDDFFNRMTDQFSMPMPSADLSIHEDDDCFYYETEVGAADESEVNVTVNNGILDISANLELQQNRGGTGPLFSSSLAASSFRRQLPLPPNADPLGVEVNLDDGVLLIKVRKLG